MSVSLFVSLDFAFRVLEQLIGKCAHVISIIVIHKIEQMQTKCVDPTKFVHEQEGIFGVKVKMPLIFSLFSAVVFLFISNPSKKV